MIKTVLALTTGGLIGLGFLTQEGGKALEEEAQAKTIVAVASEESVAEQVENALSLTLEGHPDVKQDIIIKVVENLAELNGEMAEMTRKFGSNHPSIIRLKGKSDALKGMLLELRSDVDGEVQFFEVEGGEAAEIEHEVVEEVEEILEQEKERRFGIGGVYSVELSGDKSGPGKAIGITKDERINLRLGAPGGPAVIRSGIGAPGFSGMRPAQVFGISSTSPFSEYAKKWADASEDERAKMLDEMREKATKQFDEEMSRREKELSEIKKRYERLQNLMDRRAEKRDDIIEHHLENLQLEWEGLGFPAKGFPQGALAPAGFPHQIFSLGEAGRPIQFHTRTERFPGKEVGEVIEHTIMQAHPETAEGHVPPTPPAAPKAPQ